MEILLSFALFRQITFASGSGMESKSLEDVEEGEMEFQGQAGAWFLVICYASILIPIVCVGWSLSTPWPCVQRRLPKSWRNETQEMFVKRRTAFLSLLGDWEHVQDLVFHMDRVEYDQVEK